MSKQWSDLVPIEREALKHKVKVPDYSIREDLTGKNIFSGAKPKLALSFQFGWFSPLFLMFKTMSREKSYKLIKMCFYSVKRQATPWFRQSFSTKSKLLNSSAWCLSHFEKISSSILFSGLASVSIRQLMSTQERSDIFTYQTGKRPYKKAMKRGQVWYIKSLKMQMNWLLLLIVCVRLSLVIVA